MDAAAEHEAAGAVVARAEEIRMREERRDEGDSQLKDRPNPDGGPPERGSTELARYQREFRGEAGTGAWNEAGEIAASATRADDDRSSPGECNGPPPRQSGRLAYFTPGRYAVTGLGGPRLTAPPGLKDSRRREIPWDPDRRGR
jgi:hypothetical protein